MIASKIKLTLAFCFLIALSSINAQQPVAEHPITVTLGTGASLTGTAFRAGTFLITEAFPKLTASNSAAFQATVDYNINKRFSVGAAFSTQFNKLDGFDIDTKGVEIDIDMKSTKMNFAVKGLVHYGFNMEAVDLYSGVRIGYTNYKFLIENTGDSAEFLNLLDNIINIANDRFAPAVIPFGMRVWITDNIGLYAETHIGSPHFVSGGLSFQF